MKKRIVIVNTTFYSEKINELVLSLREFKNFKNFEVLFFDLNQHQPNTSNLSILLQAMSTWGFTIFFLYKETKSNFDILKNHFPEKTIFIVLDSSTRADSLVTYSGKNVFNIPTSDLFIWDEAIDAILLMIFKTMEITKITFTQTSHQPLTIDYLSKVVLPYLEAIENTEKFINDIKKQIHAPIRVERISQHSPIGISLEGVSETAHLITEYVIPWRRKHAEKMAEYERREKQYEIEKKRTELIEINFLVQRNKQELDKSAIESTKLKMEAEKLKIENEKARLELATAKLSLATEFLAKLAPSLSESERLTHMSKLLPLIEQLTSINMDVDITK